MVFWFLVKTIFFLVFWFLGKTKKFGFWFLVKTIFLVFGFWFLVFGYLTVLGQSLEGLVDEADVVLVDVETEEAQLAGGRSADAVQEHERLRHQIVAVLVRLHPQEILQKKKQTSKIILFVKTCFRIA